MSPVTMPLWKGTGSQSVFAATYNFYMQLREEEDSVVSRTMESIENLRSPGRDIPTRLNEAVNSSVSLIAQMLLDAANSCVQRKITDLEGLDLPSQPPRLTRRPRPYVGTDSTLMSHPPRRRNLKVRRTLTPEQPRLSMRSEAPTFRDNFRVDDQKDIVKRQDSDNCVRAEFRQRSEHLDVMTDFDYASERLEI